MDERQALATEGEKARPGLFAGTTAGGPRFVAVLYALLVAAVVFLAGGTLANLFNRPPAAARYVPRARVRLDEPAPAGGSPSAARNAHAPELRVAVAPVMSPEKSLVRYRQLVDYLATRLDRAPVFLQGEDYAEINARLRNGDCDLALICTYCFVLGQDESEVESLVIPQIAGSVTYHSLILVPADSPAGDLLDLRGKRFGSGDLLSNTGWLYPVAWLQQRGHEPARFFSEQVVTGSHDLSVRAVASRFVDGAAVASLVYEQLVRDEPLLARQTKVIHRSPPFGMPPVVVPVGSDPELRAQLRETLLNMDRSARGREILAELGIDRFVPSDDRLYDSIRRAAALLETPP